MKTSTIVAIILATGAVVLATLMLVSRKKKSTLSECGCELDHTDACCCTDPDCDCDDVDDCICEDICEGICDCIDDTVERAGDKAEEIAENIQDKIDAE